MVLVIIPVDLTVRLYLAESGMQILLYNRSWCLFSKGVDKLIHQHAHLLNLTPAVCLVTLIKRDLRAMVLLDGVGNIIVVSCSVIRLGTLILEKLAVTTHLGQKPWLQSSILPFLHQLILAIFQLFQFACLNEFVRIWWALMKVEAMTAVFELVGEITSCRIFHWATYALHIGACLILLLTSQNAISVDTHRPVLLQSADSETGNHLFEAVKLFSGHAIHEVFFVA